MLLSTNDPKERRFFCCVPKRYKDIDSYNNKLDRLDDKLLKETLKPFKPSGHAFVCFDSVKSVNIVLQKCKLNIF